MSEQFNPCETCSGADIDCKPEPDARCEFMRTKAELAEAVRLLRAVDDELSNQIMQSCPMCGASYDDLTHEADCELAAFLERHEVTE